MSNEPYHWPPDLMGQLIDCIPALCPSKRDLFGFFRGAGVPETLFKDHVSRFQSDRKSVNKYEVTRSVLERLNELGDAGIAPRREIVRRVTQWEDFSKCWENERHRARALVEDIRRSVNQKDAFTRMQIERDREHAEHVKRQRAEAQAAEARLARRETVKRDLKRLFGLQDPAARGKQLERVMNQMFDTEGILIREAFTVAAPDSQRVVEQVDGVVAIDGTLYLVEIKWHRERIDKGEISSSLVNVFSRGDVHLIVVSASGFTEGAVEVCKEALRDKVVVLTQLEEIVLLYERDEDFEQWLRARIHSAALDKRPFARA